MDRRGCLHVPRRAGQDALPVAVASRRTSGAEDRSSPAIRPERRAGLGDGGGLMGHVQDRWYKKVVDATTGKVRRERTPLFGKGDRYKVRYVDHSGRERSKSFPDRQKKQ